ncbi:MAG TPA: cryptochrome/photolyase family protein [Planctomycetaceae bacterium]|nr:cryptochrome/photolyase family protein [Planctomycetaceae bacterium]
MLAALIYPHQLFANHPAIAQADLCVLIEEPLLFTQYRFHAHKLVLHIASMDCYKRLLHQRGKHVQYVESREHTATAEIAPFLKEMCVTRVQFVDPNDDWLQQRLTQSLDAVGIDWIQLDDPHFLTPTTVFDEFAANREKLLFADFYRMQRQRLGLLLDERGRPLGAKWSHDAANRKKLPRSIDIPQIAWPESGPIVADAQTEVSNRFPRALGNVESFHYPVTTEQAVAGLEDFLDHRFTQFGEYEDAIDCDEAFLFHSVLTPALNIGLLSPQQIIDAALERADDVPLNSLEGFVRQIIGWREYMRGVYRIHGRKQRNGNFWQHEQPMPKSFYDGTTGIEPVDTVIRRVLKHAYCHHIERLMILGNFMLLCEIDPNAIYQWFMEFFIDAYDWVMVPNVYGMSQHADGGLITTKPYISGSSYVLKMSRFRKGNWCPIWDALYWRFIHKHQEFFAANHRMSVMTAQCRKMGTRLDAHLKTAETFLEQLHQQ